MLPPSPSLSSPLSHTQAHLRLEMGSHVFRGGVAETGLSVVCTLFLDTAFYSASKPGAWRKPSLTGDNSRTKIMCVHAMENGTDITLYYL